MTWNHSFHLEFEVPGCEYEDCGDVLEHEGDKVLAALRERINLLKSDEFQEAISGFDSFEEDPE